MSMYNMLFGVMQFASAVFMIMGHHPDYYSRARDGWVEKLPDGSFRIAIYTRNGGGNRDHYGDNEKGINCNCTGCVMTYKLPADPLYISDSDDSFDSTYAVVYFKVPEDYKERLRKHLVVEENNEAIEKFDISLIAIDPIDTSKRWRDALDSLKAETSIEGELIEEEEDDTK